MESYRVGSVAWSMRYFPDAQFTPSAFRMAEIAAKAVLDEALNAYRPSSWDVATALQARSVQSPTYWGWPVVQRPR